MASNTHTKLWTEQQDVPEYKVLHQFHLQFTCNTLKIPAINSFGHDVHKQQYFLNREFINGEHPKDLNAIIYAYKKLVSKMPKPLCQSTIAERSAWGWLKEQLSQYNEPEASPILQDARSYLSQKANQPAMLWTHTAFLPEHLIQNSDGIYLINFRHVGYRPQYFGLAQLLHHFKKIEAGEGIYSQIALALIEMYRKPTQTKLNLIEQLLNITNA